MIFFSEFTTPQICLTTPRVRSPRPPRITRKQAMKWDWLPPQVRWSTSRIARLQGCLAARNCWHLLGEEKPPQKEFLISKNPDRLMSPEAITTPNCWITSRKTQGTVYWIQGLRSTGTPTVTKRPRLGSRRKWKLTRISISLLRMPIIWRTQWPQATMKSRPEDSKVKGKASVRVARARGKGKMSQARKTTPESTAKTKPTTILGLLSSWTSSRILTIMTVLKQTTRNIST